GTIRQILMAGTAAAREGFGYLGRTDRLVRSVDDVRRNAAIDERALIEDALGRIDAALEEHARSGARVHRQVESFIDVGLAAEVRREGQQVVLRNLLSHDRLLQIVQTAYLVAAAAREVRIGRRVQAERPVVAAVGDAVALSTVNVWFPN